MTLANPHTAPREFLRQLYEVAVARALPTRNLAAHLPQPPARGRTLVLGAGKAAGAMAEAVEAAWPVEAPLAGLVVTRYGHVPPGYRARRIEIAEAAHPVPDEAGRAAARRIADLARGAGADDLVLCLISGGGSATLSLPGEDVTLQDKQAITRALLKSGATIGEMNCVRTHLSAIKGGRLGALCAPARVLTLCISDVPGDDPALIASGPTVPDPTTCADALEILRRYAIDIPPSVRAGLESGRLETPKPGDARFAHQEVRLIATPALSLAAAAAAAQSAGIEAHVLSDEIEGESHVVGRVHAALARAVARKGEPFGRPCVLLSGGETTVTVRGEGGRGGRATEFLMGCALALQGATGIHAIAADTDGIDGVEDNAGAFVAPDTLARAAALGLKTQSFLDRNDAYSFFAPLGDLLVTGPSHTNVNDFRALLVL